MEVRVRFAPSPTGYLHIGGARTALFNWLFARHNGGKFILRIEDTDAERTIEDSCSQIIRSLRWLGLDWDEGPEVGGPRGPYFQSQRRHLYAEYAQRLLREGKAYYCYCTPEELAARRSEALKQGRAPRYDGICRELSEARRKQLEAEGRRPAIRLRTPDEGVTVVHDEIHGDVAFENALIGDFVIVKSDGFPTYNFGCVIDDSLMGMTHVIRADEHLSNTPKQLMIYEALGLQPPAFAHVPMILAPDRSKLSKRHGATSVEEFRDAGYLPEAIVNYLALLGWTPGENEEIMPLSEMVKRFRLEDVSHNPAIYDTNKLTWINGNYIRELDLDYVARAVIPFLEKAGYIKKDDLANEVQFERIRSLVGVVRDRAKTLVEMVDALSYFFEGELEYDEKGVRKYFTKPETVELLVEGMRVLGGLEVWNTSSIEAAYRELAERKGVSSSALFHPTRLAITGRTIGPGLFEIMELLGKQQTLRRMAEAVEYIENMPVEKKHA
ncbi:MAG TPA: glutamate--tRNA ligase [Firmicutes bacterium]|nr:glutamate--tRNA ligase [Bacillota bacterium]